MLVPNPYSTIPSPTLLVRQEEPFADPVQATSIGEVPIIFDTRPLPPIAMIAVKIYAFGGLAFLFGVMLAGISYWIWVVVIQGEYADSPPELDIHPERMREKEKARIVRLKAKKAKKDAERQRREVEKWCSPLRHEKKRRTRQTLYTNDCPAKSALRNSPLTSKSACPAKKHVRWASSTLALEGDGNLTTEPMRFVERGENR